MNNQLIVYYGKDGKRGFLAKLTDDQVHLIMCVLDDLECDYDLYTSSLED